MKKVYFFLYCDDSLPWTKWLAKGAIVPYNHIFISLDREMREAYGFKILGGCSVVQENIENYSRRGRCLITSKEVTDEQYSRLKAYLRSEVGKKYSYDYLGTFVMVKIASPLYRKYGISLPRALMRKILVNPKKRTCGSFIGLALAHAGIKLSPEPVEGIPGTMSPFLVTAHTLSRVKELNLTLEYEGTVEGLLSWAGRKTGGTCEDSEVRFQYSCS